MEEELISLGTAKLAKDKGFGEECSHYFDSDEESHRAQYYEFDINNITGHDSIVDFKYARPTQSLLQKWLRDVHKIRVFPANKFAGDFGFEIYVVNPNKEEIVGKPWVKLIEYWTLHFKTYEEALEKGLQEALNKL